MSNTLIKIDPSVYLLNDIRVDRLMNGKLSVRQFASTITAKDPFLLVHDTVYALNRSDFYALQLAHYDPLSADHAFRFVLAMDNSMFSKEDAARLDKIRNSLPNCSACRFKKYRNEVYKLIDKYDIRVPFAMDDGTMPEYPETKGEIPSILSSTLISMGRHAKEIRAGRRFCFDCVEKHIAQAYVLSKECSAGYPEHWIYAVGHLGEAIDESPVNSMIKEELLICLAATQERKEPFVPLSLLMHTVLLEREAYRTEDDDADSEMPVLDYDGTVEVSDTDKVRVSELIKRLSDNSEWEGAMAILSEITEPYDKKAANVLRNIRLLFKEAPENAEAAGYGTEFLHRLFDIVDGSDSTCVRK